MGKNSFEFWFDFASTYSYLSVYRIENLAQQSGIDIDWKPFLLGPFFNSQGWDTSPFNIYKAKGDYMWRDIERNCEKFGIPFTKPSEFPRNGLLASRVAIAFDSENWVPEYTRLLFRANFADDKNISDKEVITSILKSLDLDANKILQQATTQENKDKLRERTELATEKGIFGAPTFVIGDEMFWGNDRLEDAFSWYEKRK